MSTNGSRRPPRPRIELVAGNPTEEETAAVMAALEQFLAETAPSPVAAEQSRWQRAALREGVLRDPGWEPGTSRRPDGLFLSSALARRPRSG